MGNEWRFGFNEKLPKPYCFWWHYLVGHATEELKHDLETPPPVIMALVVLHPKSFNSWRSSTSPLSPIDVPLGPASIAGRGVAYQIFNLCLVLYAWSPEREKVKLNLLVDHAQFFRFWALNSDRFFALMTLKCASLENLSSKFVLNNAITLNNSAFF